MEIIPGRVFVATRSGEYVAIASGLSVITESGAGVIISGQGVTIASGLQVNIGSGVGVLVASGLAVILQSGAPVSIQSGTWVNIGSGVGVTAALASGTGVIVQTQSGGFVTLGSGVAIVASGLFISQVTATLSGQYVQISGQGVLISGQTVVVASGLQVIQRVPGTLRARAVQRITDLSGGQVLASAGTVAVAMKSLDGDLYVGGAQDIDFPYSGYGMVLTQGDAMTVDIQNPNLISLMAIVSGYRVSYLGQQ
jgi:hypothetical protein